MALFIARRLAFGATVLIAIIFLTILGFTLLGEPQDRPVLVVSLQRTAFYLGNLIRGNLGTVVPGSIAFREMSVAEMLPTVVSHSLGLLGVAFLIAIVGGVALGAWTAAQKNKQRAVLLILTSIIGISTPSFFAALFLQLAAIQYTKTVGVSLLPVGGFGWDKHLVLPALVLAARPIAQIARITYISISGEYNQDYVRTAKSKGQRERIIFWIHIFRNAMVPILTTVAVSLRFSLSTLPVVEVYFGWGGMGEALTRALFLQDIDLTLAIFLILGVLFILVNLFLEVSYMVIDPRMRAAQQEARLADKSTFKNSLITTGDEVLHFFIDSPLGVWIRERFFPGTITSARFERSITPPNKIEEEIPAGDTSQWRAWRRGLLGNIPLLLGGLIVAGLVYIAILGPQLAPYSPTTTQIIGRVDGVLTRPPFPPSEAHPWGTDARGRDMLSLILAGAQQTMILALVVVAARMLIGFTLGVLAGWFADSMLDKFLIGLTQAIAVFPTLLLAALLIFILGDNFSMRTFIIALSFVGWGEIMEFVRGKVMTIRPRPYIESAMAVGQRTSRMVLIHVLPNLAPALVSVAALEVGAVLLILGELGFLHIFIQGGTGTDSGLYSRVPEWGSLMEDVRRWTRPYPWTGFYPSAAFFVAVLGFTLLGEGIRQLVDEVGLVMNKLVNRYTLAFAGIVVASFFWIRGNTGELVFFRQQAETFQGEQAREHIVNLVGEEMQGRALGSAGMRQATEYVANQYRSLGLQAGGSNLTYFQEDVRTYSKLESDPVFEVEGANVTPQFLDNYTIYPTPHQNSGEGRGILRILAMGDAVNPQEIDLRGQVPLLLRQQDLSRLQDTECEAVLILAEDLSQVKRRYTYATGNPPAGCGVSTPVLWVGENLASQILTGKGVSLRGLKETTGELAGNQTIDEILEDVLVHVSIKSRVEQTMVVNVIGQLPGTNESMDHELIIVASQYDTPPVLGGEAPQAANDNASGVGVMLEAIRTIQESGYEPYRTYLFVAYSGEGLPDLRTAPEVHSYLQARSTFANVFDINAVIYIRGMGIGTDDSLAIYTTQRSDLAKRMEAAASLADVRTERVNQTATMNIFPPVHAEADSDSDYPVIGVSRVGWERSARLFNDTVTFINTEEMGSAGEALTLALMVLGR